MINEEIGTYPIVAALDVEPMLPMVEINHQQVMVHLNGRTYIGNMPAIRAMFPDYEFNITKEIEEVKIHRERSAIQVLGEDFGIEYDDDWLQCMENPEEVWREAQALADEKEEVVDKIKTNFDFNERDDDDEIYFKNWE